MPSFTTHVDLPGGDVYVLTKSRFLGVLKRPATSVVPRHGLGIQFRWTTDEPDTLEYVHRLVVKLVYDIPYTDLRAIVNLNRNFNREAAKIGKKFAIDLPSAPFPEDFQEILPYIKSIT
jgi:hypothetical protein